MLATPDFGHSDIWHFNFALKYVLSQTLKNGYLPFWNKNIGTGFPIFAEGQIGLLNPANLLLFRLLKPEDAFNMSLLGILLFAILGSYLYGRAIKLNKLAALSLGIMFGLGAPFITQLTHFNLVQTASFLPWEFFFVEKLITAGLKRYVVFFALALGLQIYSGFPQVVIISLFGITIYSFLRIRLKKIKVYGVFGLAIILGILFASPQLLATYQLTQLSFRNDGTALSELVRFPYHPSNLLTFIYPYIWGNPRLGTYPVFSKDWGIFWESTGYIGLIPLVLIFLLFLKTKRTNVTTAYVTLACLAFVLMLGKFSPFFFIFQLPPLSYFRVPARFLILFVWTLCVLSALGFHYLSSKQRVLSQLLFAGLVINLTIFASTYHATISASSWLSKPESVHLLDSDTSWFRLYSLPPYKEWNALFNKQGWNKVADYYNFRNALDANQNLYWDLPQMSYYAGVAPRRLDLWQTLVDRGLGVSDQGVKITTSAAKLLSLAGVKYFITPRPVLNDPANNFSFFASLSAKPVFYLYKNAKQLPHAYLTTSYLKVNSLDDLQKKILYESSYDTALVERDLPFQSHSGPLIPVLMIQNGDNRVVLETNYFEDSLLVLSDSYYPNWQATIDGKKTEIYPANLNQRAVFVPQGKHRVIFQFNPLKLF